MNPTNSPVTYNLSVQGVPASWVNLVSTITVPANSTAPVHVPLTLTSDTSAAAADNGFTVTASGDNGATAFVHGDLILQGTPVLPSVESSGVVVALTPAQASAGPGTTATYQVQVTNTGSAEDTFNLAAVGLPSTVTATFSQTTIDVPPGASNFRTVNLTLTPAAGTATGNLNFHVTATSATKPVVSNTANGTLNVLRNGVSVMLQPTASGFNLTVKNTGQVPDTFDLALGGPAGLTATLGTKQVKNLAAGASQVVPITLGALNFALAGTLTLTATATSHTNPAVQSSTPPVSVHVPAVPAAQSLSAQFTPATRTVAPKGTGTFLLQIQNTGNSTGYLYTATIKTVKGPVTAQLVGANGQPAQGPVSFLLPALTTGAITLQATMSGTGSGTVTVQIQGTSPNGQTVSTTATATITAAAPAPRRRRAAANRGGAIPGKHPVRALSADPFRHGRPVAALLQRQPVLQAAAGVGWCPSPLIDAGSREPPGSAPVRSRPGWAGLSSSNRARYNCARTRRGGRTRFSLRSPFPYVFSVSDDWFSGLFCVAAAVSAAPGWFPSGAAETAAATQKGLTSDGETLNTYPFPEPGGLVSMPKLALRNRCFRFPHFAGLLCLVILSARSGTHAQTIAPGVERPRPSAAFVDSIGVNTHLGYTDTIYRRYDEVIRPRLAELGIRHIRDGLRADRKDVVAKLNDLAGLGIRSDLLLPPEQAVAIAKEVRKSVETVEGPNEPDHGSGWEAKARERQIALYRAIKGDAETARLPVLVSGMANTRDSPGRLGSLVEALDFGNTHSYPGGLPLTSGGWGISLDRAFAEARKVCDPKPLICTETGYHNRLEEKGHPGVTEAAAAKYIPRLLLTYFDRGIVRTYLYEFADEKPDPEMRDMEQHFGLLRVDGTPKPAFVALQNWIARLRDPGPAFEPGAVAFTIEGDTRDVRHVLLGRRDGAFDLILWREVLSYDLQSKQDKTVTPGTLTVRLQTPFAKADLFRPGVSTEPVSHLPAGREVTVQVADDPVLVRAMMER